MSKSEDSKVGITASFTSPDEIKSLIETMAASNQEALKAFAAELAYKLAHPDKTEEEKARQREQIEGMLEEAREREQMKALKRRQCPHKRVGQGWGLFAGSSVIAWTFPMVTTKNEQGLRGEYGPVAFGVCMWCQSEFKPGDPDYAEVLSWGVQPAESIAQMNINTGVWV